MGAAGVEIILAYVEGAAEQGHRMIPVLQITADPKTAATSKGDLDCILDGPPDAWTTQLMALIASAASGECKPKLFALGHSDFQLTRGLLGVST